MRFNTIPSAVVSASVNTVGGVPLCRDDDAAKADVVADKLRQPLSPAENRFSFSLNVEIGNLTQGKKNANGE